MPLATRLLAASRGYSYWLSILGANAINQARHVTGDGQGNYYAAADIPSLTGGTRDLILVKFNSNGIPVWRRLFGGSGYNAGVSVAMAPGGDVVLCGVKLTPYRAFVAVVSPSGSLQWQKDYAASYDDRPGEAVVSASGDIYICGQTRSSSTAPFSAFLAKVSSAGALVWQKLLSSTNNVIAKGVAIDSLGDIYVAGYVANAPEQALLAKYSSSGTALWQRVLSSTRDNTARRVKVDGNGDVYICGTAQETGASTYEMALVAKYSSAGSLAWQRTLSGAIDVIATGLFVDGSNNVYVSGYQVPPGTGSSDVVLASLDASGGILWQRTFAGSGTEYPASHTVDSQGNLGLFLYSLFGTNDYRLVMAQLPSDGSMTGSYSIFSYQPSTFVHSLGALTGSTPSLVDSSHALSASTSTLGFYSLNLGRSFTPIV